MAWTAYTIARPEDIKTRLQSLKPAGEDGDECLEQFEAAKDAALTLVTSGVLGTNVACVISLSGHSNHDHKPPVGWAPDGVTVHVAQAHV